MNVIKFKKKMIIREEIRTNIIAHYELSCQDYDLASQVCVNFIHEWRDLQFNFGCISGQFYLLSELLPEICWEKVAEEIFSFWCLNLTSNDGFLRTYFNFMKALFGTIVEESVRAHSIHSRFWRLTQYFERESKYYQKVFLSLSDSLSVLFMFC